MIEHTYYHGPGEAGVDIITSYEDFVLYHIQDEDVALEVADDLVAGEVVEWTDEGPVKTTYRCIDTDLLADAIKEEREREATRG